MKCFICRRQYDPNDVEDFSFWDFQDLHTVSKLQFKDKDIPLCNACFKQTMLSFCINGNYDIQIEDIADFNEVRE